MYSESYDDRAASGAGFIMGVMCGTALGAALGLIFAPKAGSELRQQLSDSTERLKQKAAETADQLKRSATDAYRPGVGDRPGCGGARTRSRGPWPRGVPERTTAEPRQHGHRLPVGDWFDGSTGSGPIGQPRPTGLGSIS